MSQTDAILTAMRNAPNGNSDAVYRAVGAALNAQLFEQVRDYLLSSTAINERDGRFWQYLGLAHRGLYNSADAHAAFLNARKFLPNDPLIAHSVARTALEAGFPAVSHFENAHKYAPNDGNVLLGQSAALVAEGRAHDARDALKATLAQNPDWIEGHQDYARLCAIVGRNAEYTATIKSALTRKAEAMPLWQTLLNLQIGASDFNAAGETVAQMRAQFGTSPDLELFGAICLSETGKAVAAQKVFDVLPLPTDANNAVWVIRNLIRLGRYDHAAQLAEFPFPASGLSAIWPYRALLWRLLGDDRWHWLEGDARLIGSYDLSDILHDFEDLVALLRHLHGRVGQPLEQSVRGGTQTDGMLFARDEPEIRHLRAAIEEAVRAHIAQLPPSQPGHPTLDYASTDVRFAGAWSVRLSGSGFHVDHVHTMGWLSSACYLALPQAEEMQNQAGYLTFGENRALLPDFDAFKVIAPKVGQLVLFPSTMWHGTRPFSAGERLTVAFDIARPAAI